MKRIYSCCLTVAFLFAFSVTSFAQIGAERTAERTEVDSIIRGGIVTLYALDPLARAFCFADGKDGQMFYKGQVRNRCSDIDFNAYNAGSFTVGIEGGRIGTIVDLGNATDLRTRYGYAETVGNGQGFASLHVEGGRVVILKNLKGQTAQDLEESTLLFQKGASGAKAPIKIGNIYLLRITDPDERDFLRIVKLIVLAYTPNESVTIRWHVM